MKRMYRCLAIALVLCIALSNVAILSGSAASVVCKGPLGEKVTWELDSNGVLTLRGIGELPYGWPWQIPVKQWDDVEKIVIEEGITVIDVLRFSQFENVKSVVFPVSLCVINERAFDGCEKLKQIYYCGSQQQWKKIRIYSGNEALTNARITYYSDGSAQSLSSGQKGISVKVGERFLKFDVTPQIINGRTMVPMRAIFEAFGALILWNNATQTVIAVKDGLCLRISIGSDVMYRNNLPIQLDAPACTIQERTMVPVRVIAESFGVGVEWDPITETVYIEPLEKSIVFLCAEDGRVEKVSQGNVAAQKQVGWYDYPVVRMYEPMGTSKLVHMAVEDMYKAQGWYEYPVVTVYAADGRTMVIDKSALEAYKAVGWYHLYPMTVYAADGRTMQILSSDLEAYKAVGWYASLQEVSGAVVEHLNKTVSVKLIVPHVGTMNSSAKIQISNVSGSDIQIIKVCANGTFLKLHYDSSSIAKSGVVTTSSYINTVDSYYPMYLDNNSIVFVETTCNGVKYYARGDVYGNTVWGTSKSSVGWY